MHTCTRDVYVELANHLHNIIRTPPKIEIGIVRVALVRFCTAFVISNLNAYEVDNALSDVLSLGRHQQKKATDFMKTGQAILCGIEIKISYWE